MNIALRSGLLSAVLLLAATPAHPCDSAPACLGALEANLENGVPHHLAMDALSDFGPDAVAPILDRIGTADFRLRSALKRVIWDLDKEDQRSVTFSLVRRGSVDMVWLAADLMGRSDERPLIDWFDGLPSSERAVIHDAVRKALREEASDRLLRVASVLPMDEQATLWKRLVVGLDDAAMGDAWKRLRSSDPNAAEAVRREAMRAVTTERQARDALSTFDPSGYGDRDARFNWLAAVHNDVSLPNVLRRRAALQSVDLDNTSPPPLDAELAAWILEMDDDRKPSVPTVLRLYGNDAVPLLVDLWQSGHRRQGVLQAFNAGPVTAALTEAAKPMVGEALNELWNDHEIVVEALQLQRKLGLKELDALAARVDREHPIDLVRVVDPGDDRMLFGRILDRPERQNPNSYCTMGEPFDRSGMRADRLATGREAALVTFPEGRTSITQMNFNYAVSATAPFGDRLLVAADRGEWYGGLISLDADDPTDKPELLTDRNVQFLAPVRVGETSEYWVMSGLNHMFPRGQIMRLDADGLRMHYRVDSAVKQLRRMEDHSLILSFHDEAAEPKRWLSYHPPLRLYPDGRVERACE